MPSGLTALETAVVEKLLGSDHAVLTALRLQVGNAEVTDREMTVVGFFTSLRVDPVPIRGGLDTYVIDDVFADVVGLAHGAGFLLCVSDGVVSMLEGYTFDERWPDDVDDFTLRYSGEPRVLSMPPDVDANESVSVVLPALDAG